MYAARIVQSSQPICVLCIFHLAAKRPTMQTAPSTSSASPTFTTVGPVFRTGALHAFFCHACAVRDCLTVHFARMQFPLLAMYAWSTHRHAKSPGVHDDEGSVELMQSV